MTWCCFRCVLTSLPVIQPLLFYPPVLVAREQRSLSLLGSPMHRSYLSARLGSSMHRSYPSARQICVAKRRGWFPRPLGFLKIREIVGKSVTFEKEREYSPPLSGPN